MFNSHCIDTAKATDTQIKKRFIYTYDNKQIQITIKNLIIYICIIYIFISMYLKIIGSESVCLSFGGSVGLLVGWSVIISRFTSHALIGALVHISII